MRRILQPHLWGFGIAVSSTIVGKAKAAARGNSGKGSRGGGCYVEWEKDIGNCLKDNLSNNFRLTTLFDLYGLPADFPEQGRSAADRSQAARCNRLEQVDILKAPRPRHSFYVLGGSSDQDSGGWLLEKLEANIIYCAKEKWQKISDVKTKYPVRWLALVDHIGFSLDDLECDLFVERVSIDHEWDKILIVDAHDESRYLEL